MTKRKLYIIIIYLVAIAAFTLQFFVLDSEAEASGSPSTTIRKVTLYEGYKNYSIHFNNLSKSAVVTYKSSNKNVASVTKSGVIKPVANGTAYVTVTIKQSKKTYHSKINVSVKKPYVSITEKTKSLAIGSNFTFTGKSYGITDPNLIWTSSNYTLAAIDEATGLLATKRAGTVLITLQDKTTGRTEQIAVKVTEPTDNTGFLSAANERKQSILMSDTNVVITGTCYYVSNYGNDLNDGLTKESAWATLDKVNSSDLKPGDGVMFERGGIWRSSLIAQEGVTYSAWGDGDKPKIYGSPENGANPEKWTLLEGTDNIWIYYKNMVDCGTLVFNDGESCAVKELPTFRYGKFVLRKDNEKDFNVIDQFDHNLEFFSKADSHLTKGAPFRYGMKNADIVDGLLYLRCDEGNPGEIFDSIEFLTRGYIITPADGAIYDNLCLKYCGSHAIFGWGVEITVQNCEFGWIGGSVQYYDVNNGTATRFGNAVEACGSYDSYKVTNCYVYQVYDAGLTNQDTDTTNVYDSSAKNIVYSGNLIEYCTYGFEVFINTGDAKNDHNIKNLLIEDNIILYTGYGWGSQRLNKSTPASIQLWDRSYPIENFTIKDNVLYLSTYRLIRCGAESKWLPELSGNTFVQYKSGSLGRWRTSGETKIKDYSFSAENLKDIIKNVLGDKTATVISIED